MKVTILGSGTGAPSLERGASGLLLQIKDQNLLFDTGPGSLRQLLKLGISYHDIERIFYTHFHTDHTLDLAAILFAAKYGLSLRTKRLDIVAARGLEDFYKNLLNLYGDVIRPEAYQVRLREIGEEALEFGEYKIKTMRMQHAPESLGYRIESKSGILVYSGDTDNCANIVKLGQGADVLLLECSFPDEMKVKGHLVPAEAARIARQSNCKRLVLSHLYPVCSQEDILKQARAIFKGQTLVACDLMSFELSGQTLLRRIG